ncbi:MAG: hypothetical protein AAF587_33350, partial [Bacteroidota bacterium]
MEYFFDLADPGYGQATPLPIVPGDSIWELDSISLAGLSAGFHQLHVRVKDSTGLWSFTQNK